MVGLFSHRICDLLSYLRQLNGCINHCVYCRYLVGAFFCAYHHHSRGLAVGVNVGAVLCLEAGRARCFDGFRTFFISGLGEGEAVFTRAYLVNPAVRAIGGVAAR